MKEFFKPFCPTFFKPPRSSAPLSMTLLSLQCRQQNQAMKKRPLSPFSMVLFFCWQLPGAVMLLSELPHGMP